MTVEVANTLVTLPRASSASDSASQDVADLMDSQGSILEDMELAAAEEGLSGSSTMRKKRKKADDTQEEASWMKELRHTMQANQSLLEKLLEDKTRRHTTREPFIEFVTQTLRSCADEQYTSMQEGILDMLRPRVASLPHSRAPSWSRPGPAIAPPAGPSSQQPYYPQQQPYFPQPPAIQDQSSSWHFTGYQPQGSQPIRVPRSRDSADAVGRLLNIGDDWESNYAQPSGSSRQSEESEME